MSSAFENVWKEVFLAGTDWDQFGDVASIDWDFGHLDDALQEGDLSSGKVFLFGCTERKSCLCLFTIGCSIVVQQPNLLKLVKRKQLFLSRQ